MLREGHMALPVFLRCVKVLAILDRREGGSDELRRRGYDFTPLLAANGNGNGEIEVVG